ncbi:MAG: hypothetical protein WCK92_07920 [Bacteroidota bacterium]
MNTKLKPEPTIFTIEGKDYLALPEVSEFTEMDKGTIQQRIYRDRDKKTLGIKRIKTMYVFVPYEICLKWKSEASDDNVAAEIKQMLSDGLTLEELREMAAKKLGEKKG